MHRSFAIRGWFAVTLVTALPGQTVLDVAGLRPLLKRYCFGCHGERNPKGGVTLSTLATEADLVADFRLWRRVAAAVESGAMPPAKRRRQPAPAERAGLVAGIRGALAAGASRADPGRPVLRRLNRSQFDRTVSALFLGLPFRSADRFPKDAQGYGFDSVGDVMFSSPLLIEKYLDVTQRAIDALAARRDLVGRLIPQQPGEGDDPVVVARPGLAAFLARAFRRPVTEAEIGTRLAVVRAELASGRTFEQAVLAAMRSALLSPLFLFRVEEDRPGGKPWRLPDRELAVRLSYFLWGSMPDDRLFEVAAAGTLHRDEVLRAEVERMLDDPQARALADDFAAQWLGFREIGDHAMDVRRFRGFHAGLKADLYEESARFFHDLVERDLPLTRILDADYTFLNARLAGHYGIPGVKGGKLRRVTLPDRRRGGILGMGSILTVTSYPLRTSPVKRGQWVLTRLLGDPAAPPPPDAGELPADDKLADALTNRQRLERHRSQARCASCHAKLDPPGFALESYDGVGRWRTSNHGRPIDASAKMPDGTKLTGPVALKDWLLAKQSGAFVRTAAAHAMVYALGRDLGLADELVLDRVVAATRSQGDRTRALLLAVAMSYPFRHRR